MKNEEECKEVFEIGSKNRVTESTKMNKYSSRSHSIFMISIENNYPNEKLEENIMTKGTLYLVDLAGSEKVAKSYLKGEQLEQAKKNNNTLNVLGNCINCIISNESFIPFRESKLTRILQDTLLGNANTSLIVTLSPSNLNVEETFSSLNFASKMMNIKINPEKNYCNITENTINKLKIKILELSDKLDKLVKKYKIKEEENEIREQKEKEEKEKTIKIINEYEEKIKIMNLTLQKKEEIIKKLYNEINDIQQKYDSIMSEKDELDEKIIKLKKSKKNILDQKTKELLIEQGIDIEEINNKKINQIIKQLINDKKENENLKSELSDLNNHMEETKKNYEEKYNIIENEKKTLLNDYSYKINDLEKENYKLYNINNINMAKMNDIEEEKNQMQKSFSKLSLVESEKNLLENELRSLNKNNEILKLENSKLITQHKEIINKYQSNLRKLEENKINRINTYTNHLQNIRLASSINFNEKLLNNSINIMNNDLELFNKFKKEFKGIEIIIDRDIPSLTENNYDIIMNKTNIQKDKMENVLNNLDDIISKDKIAFNSKSFPESISKLNEILKEYKDNFINVYLLLKKSFNKLIELCQINKKTKQKKLEYALKNKKAKEEKSKNEQEQLLKEKEIKNKIYEIILTNIDKFKPICYYTDNSDLKDEMNNLYKESENFSSVEILEKAINILEKIILRSADYRMHKEKEIQNLNCKITYFLRELGNYKKYYNNHKTSELDEEKRLLNNQLFLQDGEINRLNKENDKLLKTMEDLMTKIEEINQD